MIFNVVGSLLGQVIGLFGEKGKASKEAIQARVSNMERSYTDEVIGLYWFGPSFIAWFDPERAVAIQSAMFSNQEIVAVQVAITAAVFGLGKINGRK